MFDQQQVHFEFKQGNYLIVTFVKWCLKWEFWYQMVIVSRFSQSVQTLSLQGKGKLHCSSCISVHTVIRGRWCCVT